MKILLISCLVFLFNSTSWADPIVETPEKPIALMSYPFEFEDHNFSSSFEKTLIFGHSISSNLLANIGLGVEKGPGNILAEVYSGKEVYQNVAKGAGQFSWSDLGLGRLLMFMGRVNHEDTDLLRGYYKESTSIVGVDAFYMGAMFDTCGDLERSGYNTESIIRDFIHMAHQDGKVTILGNMPDEKMERMNFLAKLAITSGQSSQWKSCKDKINRALKKHCIADNTERNRNCYLVDLEKIVNDMDTNNGAFLRSKRGGFHSYYDYRPDGANLSTLGVQLVVEEVLHSMKVSPPQSLKGEDGLK